MDVGREIIDQMFSAAYAQLRRLAATVRSDDVNATLNPTALVNEAYLKLSASPDFKPESELHFKRIAARAMRQVLVEAARRRGATKRGGLNTFITFNEEIDHYAGTNEDLLTIHHLIEELSCHHPRQAQIVEYRYFAGFSVAETADLLGVSEATIIRDWRFVRAWMSARIRHDVHPASSTN